MSEEKEFEIFDTEFQFVMLIFLILKWQPITGRRGRERKRKERGSGKGEKERKGREEREREGEKREGRSESENEGREGGGDKLAQM